jgi:hypothetical protein
VGLKELIYACQDPALGLATNSVEMYARALALRSTDPERDAIVFQRFLDREPNAFGGSVARDLTELNSRLYRQRAQRRSEQAEAARAQGVFGAEAGALGRSLAWETKILRCWPGRRSISLSPNRIASALACTKSLRND